MTSDAPLIARATAGAEAAITAETPAALVEAFAAQVRVLGELGALASAPIVTPGMDQAAQAASEEGAAFGPSGAGGGDISLLVGGAPSSAALRALIASHGFSRLDLRLGAPARSL